MSADVYRQKAPLLYGTALFSCPPLQVEKKIPFAVLQKNIAM
jgi:hypothetical protein